MAAASKRGVLSLSKGGVLSLLSHPLSPLPHPLSPSSHALSLSKGPLPPALIPSSHALSLSKGGVLSLSKGGVLSLSKGPIALRPARWILVLIAAVVTVSITAAPGIAKPRTAFHFNDTRVTRPAGLATDTANHRYWTVNRSDDSGRAYALDSAGNSSGAVRINAKLNDVEAVRTHNGSLYLADIGDRKRDRNEITVYEVPDVQPKGDTVRHRAYRFRYPDRSHDARALLVDGRGTLSVITRGDKPGIYQAPATPSPGTTNTLTRVGTAPKHVTDGVTLTDGKVAVRDKTSVRILDPARHYKLVGRTPVAKSRSGAALGQRSDGKLLLVADSGKRPKALAMSVPDKVSKATRPSGSSSGKHASGSSSPAGTSAPASSTDDDADGIGGFGITIAVIAAALAGLAAGLVTYFVGGRSRR